MDEGNYKQAKSEQDHATAELDRALDAALAKYAAVEPRAGLEERVLANLRAEWTQVGGRAWWRWSLAAAAVAVIVVAVALVWRSGRPSPPVVANHPAVTTQGSPESGTQAANRYGNAVRPQGHRPIRRTNAHPPHFAAVVAASPKLDQFPSPQPLSEQEEILANYVAKYPERAALLAEARMEALRRDAEERRQIAAGDRDSQQ